MATQEATPDTVRQAAPRLTARNDTTVHLHHSFILGMSRVLDSLVIVGCLAGLHFAFQANFTVTYAWLALTAVLSFGFIGDGAGVYHPWRGLATTALAIRLMLAWLVAGTLTLLLAGAMSYWYHIDAQVLGSWFTVTPAVIIAAHWARRAALRALRSRPRFQNRAAIVGATDLGEHLGEALEELPWRGYRVLGYYDDRDESDDGGRRLPASRTRVVGGLSTLVEQCHAGEVDSVFITLPLGAEERVRRLVQRLANSTASVYLVPDVFHYNLLYSRLTGIQGIPAVGIYDSPLVEHAWSKRLFDLAIGIPALIALAAPMLAIAAAIKLNSRGPVFFKQTRYGVHGERIRVFKFRSMTVCEDGPVVTQAQREDDRITSVGAFLRRTSLDEIPQIFNVLGGSMSLVGPRPHAIAHNEYYRARIEGYMLRHKVKPGITGWAQINGYRGETEDLDQMAGRIEYDLDYIRNWSPWLDLKILVLTPTHGLNSAQAY